MNHKLSITFSTLIIASLLVNCRGPVKEENSDDASAIPSSTGQKYGIDPNESVVTWKGAMMIGANSHSGYVHIANGDLMMENGALSGGIAKVDMNTLEDEKHSRDNGLIKHLKDTDFFDVKKFPMSTITMGKAEPINGNDIKVTGNLTIKGITQTVTFPAKLEVANGIVKLSGRLIIDRTQWNVRYKSGKFYENLADETISDYIEFNFKIVAKK